MQDIEDFKLSADGKRGDDGMVAAPRGGPEGAAKRSSNIRRADWENKGNMDCEDKLTAQPGGGGGGGGAGHRSDVNGAGGGIKGNDFVDGTAKCEECRERLSRYMCPACGVRTCGVECVKGHKERTKCTGKRCRTVFVPLPNFTETTLLSDYFLLEEISQQADSSKRMKMALGLKKSTLSKACVLLQKAAQKRQISLMFMPNGMARRASNTSCFHKKTDSIFWRVEWILGKSSALLVDDRVDENSSLGEAFSHHLFDKRMESLLLFSSIAGLSFEIKRKPYCDLDNARITLDAHSTFREVLMGLEVLEFPSIFVSLEAQQQL